VERYVKTHYLVTQMNLAENASLCFGKDISDLKGIARLGLRYEMIIDSHNGPR
jgi:hypothetical protein